MKVELKPGVELDVLSQSELHDTLTRVLSGFARGPLTVRDDAIALPLDANGNTSKGGTAQALPIYRVPAGMQFALHRLSIQADATNAGTPFSAAGAYLEIQRAGAMQDFASLVTNVGSLPVVFRYSTGPAIVYENNQTVDLLVVKGPTSKSLVVSMQGTLEPMTLG